MRQRGIAYLKNKLDEKKTRVALRYRYYEAKNKVKDWQISTPPELQSAGSVLGWCGKAVDSLADRLVFREFADDTFDINQIYRLNNADILYDSAVLSALISSCCFLYIHGGEDGYPKIEVIEGGRATGIIDPVTNLLTEGYAVLEVDDNDSTILGAYFQSGKTTYYRKGDKDPKEVTHSLPYAALVPIIYRPDAKRPFGHSRISRSCIDIVNSAMRTVKRSEISGEFYSFPQKWVVGTSPDAEGIKPWRAAMSAMMEFSRDEDGEKPSLGQFQQQSMTPHVDQLRMFASLFAGETGLTLDDLGFATENPSSAEAIKAAHENLRLTARKAQRNFSSGFLNAGYLAACMRDDFAYDRNVFYGTKGRWEPIFEPDAAMLSSIGDGAIKINQAIPGYISEDKMVDMTGI